MIPFYRPYFDHSELLAALRPGGGRAKFESAVAGRLGVRYGIAFAYGRSGIVAALKALEIEQAEVILPAYTCEVMAQAVVASGNRPVFVDIDLADYNMDLGKIKNALSARTRAIIATYMFGYPTDVDAIRSIADDERIIIIEDRAQGMLSSFAGTAELRGDIGLCSFGPNKQLSTVQGGMIVTNSYAHYEKIKAYRDSHMDRRSVDFYAKPWMRLLASYVVFRQPTYGLLQRIGLMGWNDRLDQSSDSPQPTLPRNYAATYMDFQGRIGLAQLNKLEIIVSKRRALAEMYDCELRDIAGLRSAPMIPGATYAYYTLRIRQRDEINFPLRMLAQGVAVDQTYDYGVPLLKAYRIDARGEYPCARQAAREVVNLPIYPGLSTDNARYVAESARRAIQESFKA
jgi:perosamine synthetase